MTNLLPQTLEELAEAVITAEIQHRFADLDPEDIVILNRASLDSRAGLLGLLEVKPEDIDAVIALVDTATARIEVGFP